MVTTTGFFIVKFGGIVAGRYALLPGEVPSTVIGARHRDALLPEAHQRTEVSAHIVFLDNFRDAGAGIQFDGLMGTVFSN